MLPVAGLVAVLFGGLVGVIVNRALGGVEMAEVLEEGGVFGHGDLVGVDGEGLQPGAGTVRGGVVARRDVHGGTEVARRGAGFFPAFEKDDRASDGGEDSRGKQPGEDPRNEAAGAPPPGDDRLKGHGGGDLGELTLDLQAEVVNLAPGERLGALHVAEIPAERAQAG